jgi:hypothetical protein
MHSLHLTPKRNFQVPQNEGNRKLVASQIEDSLAEVIYCQIIRDRMFMNNKLCRRSGHSLFQSINLTSKSIRKSKRDESQAAGIQTCRQSDNITTKCSVSCKESFLSIQGCAGYDTH